jgi:putative hydrolase of the HAD superfamily
MIRYILFDLDDTLYPRGSGIMDHLRHLILRYIETHLGLPTEQAEELRIAYFRDYGTTMRGLQIHHQIDTDEFLDYVHDIPIERYIEPNPLLDRVLASLPQEKVVFTNASREHAERVLQLLGIQERIARIVDVREVDFESKPQAGAYRRICQLLAVSPEECILVEDNVRNLIPAKELGMVTVLVLDGRPEGGKAVDFQVRRVEDIGKVMAKLASRPD